MQINKRFSKGFQYGVAWTWPKSMNIVNNNGDSVNPFLNYQMRNYGKGNFDRTHNFVLNYLYSLPKLSKVWNHSVTKWVFDNWDVAGVTTFTSGSPLGIGNRAEGPDPRTRYQRVRRFGLQEHSVLKGRTSQAATAIRVLQFLQPHQLPGCGYRRSIRCPRETGERDLRRLHVGDGRAAYRAGGEDLLLALTCGDDPWLPAWVRWEPKRLFAMLAERMARHSGLLGET